MVEESSDAIGDKAEVAAAPPDDTLSSWLQSVGGIITDDDMASFENMLEVTFTAANRSPALPSSHKSSMCAAMR
jgi:hypothetical protein